MFPCGGYDPGYAAYLSSLADDEHAEDFDFEAMDSRLSLLCLAVIGVFSAVLLLVT